jgi:hypothetical protein
VIERVPVKRNRGSRKDLNVSPCNINTKVVIKYEAATLDRLLCSQQRNGDDKLTLLQRSEDTGSKVLAVDAGSDEDTGTIGSAVRVLKSRGPTKPGI